MKDIDEVLLAAQKALAVEASEGPLLMRDDAKELHDMMQMYRQVSFEREAKAAQTKRAAEEELSRAAYGTPLRGASTTVPAEHASIAGSLIAKAGGGPDLFASGGRSQDTVKARVAVSVVFWLAVKWKLKPSWPEAARVLGASNHSSIITRVAMGHHHIKAVRALYDAARAEHELHDWNVVIEGLRNR